MSATQHFLEQHDPERKNFQVDRLILFSDAVFAIAITLLIIEIKPPHIHHGASQVEIINQLLELVPNFIAFLISFFVIAIYWRSHHRIFGFVTSYNSRLILINNIFLFSIVLMPFSSAYFSENYGYTIPFTFYNINIMVSGAINYYFVRYVFNPAHQLINHQPTAIFIKLFRARAIAIPIFFLAIIMLTQFNILSPSPVIYILLWPIFIVLRLYNQRKYKDKPPVKKRHPKPAPH